MPLKEEASERILGDEGKASNTAFTLPNPRHMSDRRHDISNGARPDACHGPEVSYGKYHDPVARHGTCNQVRGARRWPGMARRAQSTPSFTRPWASSEGQGKKSEDMGRTNAAERRAKALPAGGSNNRPKKS